MPTNPDDHVVYDPRTVYFDEVVSKIVAQPQADGDSGLITEMDGQSPGHGEREAREKATGPDQMATELLTPDEVVKSMAKMFKVGDTVHAGLAQKGGAGYTGKVSKVDKDWVHLDIGKGRTIKAPLKNVQREERTFTDLRIDESAFLDPKDAEARNKLGAERIRLYNLGQKGSAEYKKVEQALYKILVKAENEWRRQVGREAYAAPPGFETEFGLRAESTDLTEAKANWKEIDFMHETRELLLNSAYGNPPCWCRATYSTGNKHKDWCKTLQQGFKGLEAAIKASV